MPNISKSMIRKLHYTLLPILIGLIIFMSLFFESPGALISPILFLCVVLVSLHRSLKMTLVTITVLSFFSFALQDPHTHPYSYWIWGVQSLVFLIMGLVIHLEIESMRKIQRYNEELTVLSSISQSLTSTLDLNALTQRIIDTILEHFSADGCTIYILNDKSRELQAIACKKKNQPPEVIQQIMDTRIRVGFSLIGWIAATGESILSGNANYDPIFPRIQGISAENDSVIGVPLHTEGKTFGVLWINKCQTDAYDNQDLQFAQIFANQVSIALANAQLYEHVRRLSETDSLTGLLNSRSLIHITNHVIKKAQCNNSQLAILFIDCDNFKSINDRFGHPMGDKFLRFLAKILQATVRDEDIVIRYAGDEFIIILPDTDLAKAKIVALRLIEEVRSQCLGNQPALSTTISVGLSIFPQHADSAEELIKHADDALYLVKRNGKNQLAIYQEGVVSA